jgi:hypothetical protein
MEKRKLKSELPAEKDYDDYRVKVEKYIQAAINELDDIEMDLMLFCHVSLIMRKTIVDNLDYIQRRVSVLLAKFSYAHDVTTLCESFEGAHVGSVFQLYGSKYPHVENKNI